MSVSFVRDLRTTSNDGSYGGDILLLAWILSASASE